MDNTSFVQDLNGDPMPENIIMDSTNPEVKPKRKRKEWVYKSEYNKLERRYNILKWCFVALWIAFAITLKIAI